MKKAQKPATKSQQQRLNKFIANNSEFSRRKADELIQAGKVFLNGQKVTELGSTINPDKDDVKIDNIEIKEKKEKIYLALNKPKSYISTRNDELDRETVMSLLPQIPNLKPVGRLDKDTEGLILFSNDGDFINKLTHPKYNCEKEYYVEIQGEISANNITKLENGIFLEGKKTAKAKIKLIEKSPAKSRLTITIHEGRKRQIRKMFASINQPVKYLQRIRIGQLKLGKLPKGKYRELTLEEINAY